MLFEKEKVLTRHLVLNKGSDKDNLDLFHCFDRKTLRGVHRLFRGVHFTLRGCKLANFISLWPIESVEKSLGALNLNLTAIPKAYKTYLLLEILFEP